MRVTSAPSPKSRRTVFVKCRERVGADRRNVGPESLRFFFRARAFVYSGPKRGSPEEEGYEGWTESMGWGGRARHVGEKYAEHCIRKSVGGGGESENRAGRGDGGERARKGGEDKREKEIGAEWTGGNRKEEERGKKGFEDSRDEESSGWVVE